MCLLEADTQEMFVSSEVSEVSFVKRIFMGHRNICVGKEVLLLCQDLFIKLSKQSSQNPSENSVFGLILICKCFRFQPGCAIQFAAIKASTAQTLYVLYADKTDIPFISMAHQSFQM